MGVPTYVIQLKNGVSDTVDTIYEQKKTIYHSFFIMLLRYHMQQLRSDFRCKLTPKHEKTPSLHRNSKTKAVAYLLESR